MLRTTLTDTTYVLSCSDEPRYITSKNYCTPPLVKSYIQITPTPYIPPPLPPCPVGDVCFTNITNQSIPGGAPALHYHMWAGFPDVNGDGCFDMFIGKHADNTTNRLYVQENIAGKCTGISKLVPEESSGHTQLDTPSIPRNTARYLFGNWYGRTDGMWSFYGHDSDSSSGARYVLKNVVNGIPRYETKAQGCWGVGCVPVDIDGNGIIEQVTGYRGASGAKIGHIKNMLTGETLYETGAEGDAYRGFPIVFDANNDGRPDIVYPQMRGYWTFGNGRLVWQANKFPALDMGEFPTGSHMFPFDCDADGDQDLWYASATYSSGNDSVQWITKGPNIFYLKVLRNDSGNFVDVTTAAGVGAEGFITNQYYHTLYSNSVPSDIDLDGLPDVVMSGENGIAITILRNRGNCTFTADRSNNFGGYSSAVNTAGRPWVNTADYNGDGLPDIIKTHGYSSPQHESIGLFLNRTATANAWLQIRVQGATTDGLHTRIIVRDVDTNRIITSSEIGALSQGYQNLIPHLGVGNRATVDIEVRRPHGGPTLTFSDVPTKQSIIIRPDGRLETYIPGSPLIDSTAPPPVPKTYTLSEIGRQYYLTVDGVRSDEYPDAEKAQAAGENMLDQGSTAIIGVDEVIRSTVLEAK